jgi:hypothetical protein
MLNRSYHPFQMSESERNDDEEAPEFWIARPVGAIVTNSRAQGTR